jgi:3-hydroxyacyl-[acyl-carrier-protein] dehydratase
VLGSLDWLPHRPPMRLVEQIVELVPGAEARCARRTAPSDWYFQGHFPEHAVVPAVVLVELVAQTGGLAAGAGESAESGAPVQLRVAALGPFKFPAAAGPGMQLEARARVVGRMGGLVKVEGEVTADGRLVAAGAVTLAAVL